MTTDTEQPTREQIQEYFEAVAEGSGVTLTAETLGKLVDDAFREVCGESCQQEVSLSTGSERDAADPKAEKVQQHAMASAAAFYDRLQAELGKRLSKKKGRTKK